MHCTIEWLCSRERVSVSVTRCIAVQPTFRQQQQLQLCKCQIFIFPVHLLRMDAVTQIFAFAAWMPSRQSRRNRFRTHTFLRRLCCFSNFATCFARESLCPPTQSTYRKCIYSIQLNSVFWLLTDAKHKAEIQFIACQLTINQSNAVHHWRQKRQKRQTINETNIVITIQFVCFHFVSTHWLFSRVSCAVVQCVYECESTRSMYLNCTHSRPPHLSSNALQVQYKAISRTDTPNALLCVSVLLYDYNRHTLNCSCEFSFDSRDYKNIVRVCIGHQLVR